MRNTSNISLKIVDNLLVEDVRQTIQDYSDNFEKIDQLHEGFYLNLDLLPSGKEWKVADKVWNKSPLVGDYVGWVNLRQGKSAPVWKPNKQYSIGNLVIPNVDNGHLYECITNGTSAPTEPSLPVTTNGLVKDLNLVNTWISSHSYQIGDIVIPVGGDDTYYYRCVTSGLSGNDEPTWSTVAGTTMVDNSVTWYVGKTVQWKEIGVSALFRPFGRIV